MLLKSWHAVSLTSSLPADQLQAHLFFLSCLQEQTGDFRRQAVSILNLMARDMPAGLMDNMDA
jgi:hypothetical protein